MPRAGEVWGMYRVSGATEATRARSGTIQRVSARSEVAGETRHGGEGEVSVSFQGEPSSPLWVREVCASPG